MAISFGNQTPIITDLTSTTSDSFFHDNGAADDRVTTVVLNTIELNINATVTYNGVSMVEQAKIDRGISGNRYIWLFSKYGTSTGSNSVGLSFSPTTRWRGGAMTVNGASQTDTLDQVVANNNYSNSTSIQAATAPSVPGCGIVGTAIAASASSMTAGANTTIVDSAATIMVTYRSTDFPIASAGSLPMNINFTTSTSAIIGAVIAPAGGGGVTANNSARRQHLMMM